ncbi:MAG: Rieske 2Fe-2S domain-containing protein [Pirellulaceae bacterium]|nr:Rieske 2Fe-2S domain-containing protein [Pirellulaceae bacterium]
MTKPSEPAASGHAAAGPPRRNLLAAACAIVIGNLVGLFPLAAGALVFFDPLFRRKKGPAEGPPYRRIASVDALPADGTPVQVPVIADLTDAWNREPNQPVGAVYLRKVGGEVTCLNAICPHAGCFVAYAAERKLFQCPCHTSSFLLDGERILPSPSPRDMDSLKVDEAKLKDGEVWVQFVNYYPGKEHQEAKQ